MISPSTLASPEPRADTQRLTAGRLAFVVGLLAVAVVVSVGVSVIAGEESLSLHEALLNPESMDRVLLVSLRLPRVLLAALVGAALAGAGAALQGLTRNPLADPFVLGVSGGAALGASLALALGLGAVDALGGAGEGGALARLSAPSVFAFAGALLAAFVVFGLSRGDSFAALLTGVVFNAFALAAITFLRALAAPERMTELVYWLSGAIGHESLSTVAALAVLEVVALLGMWRFSGTLNLLSLGEEQAASLGVSPERARGWLLLFASLAVAGAVALTGLIGFVGLLVPHVCRLWLGADARLLLPASVLGGAAFLCLADAAARSLFSVFHAEPPVGVLTALLGGPTFLLLLRRRVADQATLG